MNNLTSEQRLNETNNSGLVYDFSSNYTIEMIGDDSWAQTVLNFLNLYYLGTIIFMGLLGNGRNILFIIQSRNELRSPSYYLLAIASADIVFILTMLILWISQFGFHLFMLPGFYQIFFYLSSSSSCISGK